MSHSSDDISGHSREGGNPESLKPPDARVRGYDKIRKSVYEFLGRAPAVNRLFVAYSGGVDSHVLLHVLAQLRPELRGVEVHAAHVDHGLNPFSVEWSRHCQRECAALNIPCTVLRVSARPQDDESPEAAARRARYDALASLLRGGEMLLTAHHQDDQAETLLLQLLRGAGPRGLAAMPELARYAAGWRARPLLDMTREELHAYAQQHALQWIDDPSNDDARFDRNFLRREILPQLKQRWPAATVTLARSARHCAEAAGLLDELAEMDLCKLRQNEVSLLPPGEGQDEGIVGAQRSYDSLTPALSRRERGKQLASDELYVSLLLGLSPNRQRNALRHWLAQLNLPTPSTAHVDQIIALLHAAEDAQPLVHWPGAEVRRYRDHVYAMRPLGSFDGTREFVWDLNTPLRVDGVGELIARRAAGQGVRASACADRVVVRFRQGGERLQPAGRRETHTLKHLLQDAGVPPWQRERLPLVFVGGALVAVPGLWIAHDFAATRDESGWVFELSP